MRVTDNLLQRSFLFNMKKAKENVSETQTKLTTLKEVNAPSDSPLGASRLIKLNAQLGNISTYQSNIQHGISFVNSTINSLQNIQDEVSNVLVELTSINDSSIGNNLDESADKIDSVIRSIISLANSEFNGKYIFGGSDQSTKPFSLNEAEGRLDINSANIDGEHKIKISKNTEQVINIPGSNLFLPEIKVGGNLDKTTPNGDTALANEKSLKIYNADGEEFDLKLQFTKQDSNQYTAEISIYDSNGDLVQNLSQTKTLQFSDASGILQSVDGGTQKNFMIELPDEKIQFQLDFSGLRETKDESSVYGQGNENVNVINTLISIRDSLRDGKRPNENQFNIIDNFNSNVISKLSYAGNIINRLESTSSLLTEQDLELQNLVSEENDVDIAEAMMELQNRQFNLDLSYKVSSMLLQKSLLDYI